MSGLAGKAAHRPGPLRPPGAGKALVVPLAVGAALAILVVTAGPSLLDTRPSGPQPWQAAAAQGYVLPFAPGPGPGQSLLVVAPSGAEVAEAALLRDGWAAEPDWLTPAIGIWRWAGDNASAACPCVAPGTSVTATVYVLLGNGRLLATNDETQEAGRLRRDSNFVSLPETPWLVGPAPTARGSPMQGQSTQGQVTQGQPKGDQPTQSAQIPEQWLPAFAALERNIMGLGAGDVASAVLHDHPHRGALGPLYVTMRIDAVADAGHP